MRPQTYTNFDCNTTRWIPMNDKFMKITSFTPQLTIYQTISGTRSLTKRNIKLTISGAYSNILYTTTFNVRILNDKIT